MTSYRWSLVLSLCAASAVGCGDDPIAPTNGDPSTAAAGRLDILPSPNELRALLPTLDPEATADGDVLILREGFTLGLGPGYAERMELRFHQYIQSEECDYIVGEFEVDDASSGGFAEVSADAEQGLWITPRRPGDDSVTVRGTFTANEVGTCPVVAAGTTRPFEARIAVKVRDRAPSVRVEFGGPCAESPTKLAQSGASVNGLRAIALDEDGEAFAFANATTAAQVPVSVVASAETILEARAGSGLNGLIAEGEPGEIDIEFAEQRVAGFELVEAAEITSVNAAFGVGGGAPFELEDGAEYTVSEANQDFIFTLISTTFVGDTATCTQGRDEDFQISAPPLSACSVPADGEQHFQKILPGEMAGLRIGTDPQIERSGECRFSLRAPEYAAGDGWQTSMRVTLRDVDDVNQTGRE